jgi:hypothetical protein
MEKIDDACKFTSQLLEHGNTVEILSLKRVVGAQLLHLINNTPKPEVNTSIEFETDIKKFEAAVKVCVPPTNGVLNCNSCTSVHFSKCAYWLSFTRYLGLPYIQHEKREHFPLTDHKKEDISVKNGVKN